MKNLAATFPKDFAASIVVFLVALPLCLGIAIASGVPPAAGLITGMIGGIVVGALSGSPMQVSGPAAGLVVFTYELVQQYGLGVLAVLVVLAGAIQFLAGLARLGQVFRSMSPAVIYGMLAGIGILILGAQFHVMVDDTSKGTGIQNLMAIPGSILKGVFPMDGKTHHLAALIGVLTLAVLIVWNYFTPKKLRIIPGALVAVIFGSAAAAIFQLPIKYVELPAAFGDAIRWVNPADFAGLLLNPSLIVDAIAIAFVASAETLLCAAAVDQIHTGPRTNYDKELRAQGIGNMLCGMVGALPMTGVIVRSSANVQAGAKTRGSAMLHGVWLVAMVIAFPGILRLVPTSALAAILVYTGYKLINFENIKRLRSYGPLPLAIYLATLVTIIATDLLTGILVGLGLSMIKLLWALTHMGAKITTREDRVDVYFTGRATFVRLPKFADTLEAVPHDLDVHVHFRDLDYIDHACLDILRGWEQQRTDRGQTVVLEWNELWAMYHDSNSLKKAGKKLESSKSVAA